MQTSKIAADNKFASFLVVKDKNYFDFDLKTEVMITEKTGKIGVVFRYQNLFNFYVFEVDPVNGKRSLIVYKYGKRRVLKSIRDGGIVQANWFKIFIRVRMHSIFVKMGDSGANKSFNSLPYVFKITDSTFSNGR